MQRVFSPEELKELRFMSAAVEATQKMLHILKAEPNLSDQEIADRTGIEIDLVRTICAALA